MAKKLSRKQRKLQREKQLKTVAQYQKKSSKNIVVNKQISNAELSKIYTQIITENKRKNKAKQDYQRRKQKKLYERTQKLYAFEKVTGIHLDSLPRGTVARFDKVSLQEIENGYITIANFPELFNSKEIDFEVERPIPNGKKLHFAFRALNGEIDIRDELDRFSKYSNSELIKSLETIKEMPLTGTRNKKGSKGKNVGSSGKAGEAEIELRSQETLIDIYARQRNEDRRSNTFVKKINKKAVEKGIGLQHSNIDYHWQYIQQLDSNGKARAYTKISIRKLLIICNALMYNIKEDERQGFYNNFYVACCEIIPEMRKILP